MNWPRMTFCASALGCLLLAGCASGVQTSARADAQLIVINLTDNDWRVTVSSPGGILVSSARIDARKTVPLKIPAGEFAIEQVVLAPDGSGGLTRRFPVHFAAGKVYRWRLATLQAEEGPENKGAHPAAPQ